MKRFIRNIFLFNSRHMSRCDYSISWKLTSSLAALLLLMAVIVTFSNLDWGMPNTHSFASDAAFIPAGHKGGMEMMQANMNKYPPLQYLLYDLLVESKTPVETEEAMARRFTRARLITACQTLGTTFAVIWLGWLLFSPGIGLLAGAIFALSPMTVYLGHTTKMDQPYAFWFIICLCGLIYLNHIQGQGREWFIYVAAGLISGVTAFLALATKDQVYACLPLPYVITVVRAWREPNKKTFFLTVGALGAGILTGLAFYAGIWVYAGGFPVFKSHLAWITSEGVSHFRQFGGNQTSGLGTFLFKCCRDAFFGLGPGVAIPAVAGFLLLARKWRKKQGTLTEKAGISILLSPALSIAFFVIFITRFSYPRFWLPLLPGVCVLAAATCLNSWGLSPQKASFLRIFCGLSIFFHLLGGWEILHALENDPRLTCRREFQKIQSTGEVGIKGPIGVAGMEWGAIFIQEKDAVGEKKRAIRNWSNTKFGRLAKNQVPYFPDPLTLYCLPLPVIITGQQTQKEKNVFVQAGYEEIGVFEQQTLYLSRLEEFPKISLHVHVRKRKVEKPAITTPLWEQIMIGGAHSALFRKSTTSLKRLGQVLPPFDSSAPPENLFIKNSDITLAGIAYDQAGRLQDAFKALHFAQTEWPSETNLNNLKICASKIRQNQKKLPEIRQ
ncbi:MAG: hypothetical protein RRC34_11210 [Lentisphaeria bacterium]|nr:hypothetical protein [Lentisphaeria bacterium]